ncbi:addiction module protein [Gemmatimonas sp.]|uniref:addiction module protein n=1 Tax=Gemmatimonas sp. TaxID=1962908 RepID=UPI003563DD35
MTKPTFGSMSLSVGERLRLVGDIWDSIAEEATAYPAALPLTDAQNAERDRRMAEYDADPSVGIPLDQVLDNIRARFSDRR